MNKKFYLSLAIVLLILSISTVTFNSIYRTPKPVTNTTESQAEEPVTDPSPSNNSDDNLPPNDGQAVIAEASKDKQQEVFKPAAVEATKTNNTNKMNNTNYTSTPVSRSGQSTNTYKYPKISKVNGIFGSFHYRDLSGGRIEVDPNWIAQNIVTITLPGLNQKVQVNKAAAPNFIQAFNYIKNGTAVINGKQVPLLSLIHTMDGTFVTRHVNWNPAKGLSNHSWGTAIDINAADHFRYVNPAGEPYDPNVILWEKAFKPAGFSWGNRYSDSMHYELIK